VHRYDTDIHHKIVLFKKKTNYLHKRFCCQRSKIRPQTYPALTFTTWSFLSLYSRNYGQLATVQSHVIVFLPSPPPPLISPLRRPPPSPPPSRELYFRVMITPPQSSATPHTLKVCVFTTEKHFTRSRSRFFCHHCLFSRICL
jgi:hypothetical protein